MPLSVGELLGAHLVTRGGEGAAVVAWSRRPWVSATFEGEVLQFEMQVDAAQRAAFVEGLSDAEFPLRRHFVAEIAAETGEGGGLVVEALIIREG